MRIYRYFVCCTACFFATIGICSAEPSSTTRYLMSERTSLLDFGLYRLEEFLGTVGTGDPYVFPIVTYDWNSNRIKINVWCTDGNKFKTKIDAKKWCETIICNIRKLLAVDCSSLKSLIPTGNSNIYKYFSHDGFKPQSEPSNLGSELDKIVILAVGAYWGKNGDSKDSKLVRCEVPLLGKEIMCSD